MLYLFLLHKFVVQSLYCLRLNPFIIHSCICTTLCYSPLKLTKYHVKSRYCLVDIFYLTLQHFKYCDGQHR